MFRKIGDGLRRFMAGRYGSDRLNQCLLGAALVLILISAIGGRWVQWMSVLSLLAYIPLIWSIYRMYSRNIEARRRENTAFLRFFSRLTDKQYRYFRCPGCRQVVRVPRGKGKINIRCPKCSRPVYQTHVNRRKISLILLPVPAIILRLQQTYGAVSKWL
ncbi:MAG: hypothetical protein ACLU3F_15445 [Blautia wexlerae]